MSRLVSNWIVTFLVALTVLVPFQNCNKNMESSNSQSYTLPNLLARPAQVCGKEGFEYLYRRYFSTHCAGCHYVNGPVSTVPYFGATDLNFAYQELQKISSVVLIESVTNNRFCSNKCNLSSNDQILTDIKFWLQYPVSCP